MRVKAELEGDVAEGETDSTCSRATTGGRDAMRKKGRGRRGDGEGKGRERERREKGLYVASPCVRRLSLFIGARGFVFEGEGEGGGGGSGGARWP